MEAHGARLAADWAEESALDEATPLGPVAAAGGAIVGRESVAEAGSSVHCGSEDGAFTLRPVLGVVRPGTETTAGPGAAGSSVHRGREEAAEAEETGAVEVVGEDWPKPVGWSVHCGSDTGPVAAAVPAVADGPTGIPAVKAGPTLR